MICTQEKKRQIPNGISKHFIHRSIYVLFYSSPRKKQSWNNQRIGQMNSNFFKKELGSSFFPVNLNGGQFFVTAEDRHLWNVPETLKEFTLPVIFSSFSQQRDRHCYFFRAGQGQQQLIPLDSWVYRLKKHLRDVDVSQTCVSSEKKLILARIGLLVLFTKKLL